MPRRKKRKSKWNLEPHDVPLCPPFCSELSEDEQDELREKDLIKYYGKAKSFRDLVKLNIDFLRGEGKYPEACHPDLILLDLNLPKMDGREVLAEIKKDPQLKQIPVVILTTSEAEQDILKSYEHHANCYITKPINLDQFVKIVKEIKEFWFTIVKLPKKGTWK